MQNLFCEGVFVPLPGRDPRRGPPRSAEFDRDDARVADDLAAKAPDLGQVLIRILHLDREVVNARPHTCGLSLSRLLAIVADQGEIDRPVAQVARRMVSYLAGLHRHKAEDLLVKLACPLQVVDLYGDMDNVVHLFFCPDVRLLSLARVKTSVKTD